MTSQTNVSEPITARALTYSSLGGYDVITVADRLVRSPGPGEIRIKVSAAGVNPTDARMRDPGYKDIPAPMTPGMDAAGVVESVGADVDRFCVGDEVMAILTPIRRDGGAQAAFIVIPAASAVPKPRNLTFAEAATLPMNGLTALLALDHASLEPGQTFAVTGGAGWLASLAIPLAKRRGLQVIADARRDEMDVVRGHGADIVVERGRSFADAVRAELPDGAEALLDTALLGELSFGAIRDGGCYIPVRGWAERSAERGIRVAPVVVREVLDRTDWLDLIRELAEAGVLKARVAGEYSLEQVADAQRQVMGGGLRGRPVVIF